MQAEGKASMKAQGGGGKLNDWRRIQETGTQILYGWNSPQEHGLLFEDVEQRKHLI